MTGGAPFSIMSEKSNLNQFKPRKTIKLRYLNKLDTESDINAEEALNLIN